MFTLPQITVRKGQPITFDNPPDSESFSVIDETEQTLLTLDNNHDSIISISSTQLEKGKYLITALNSAGDIVQIIPLNVIGLFDKEDRIDTLREQISLIDKVIFAKLSDDQGVLTQLSINNKTLVYSSLVDLTALSDSLRTQLAQAVRAKRAKQGKSPMTAIKIKFTRD
ncbi:hypothetical protein OGY20_09935 [Citrobacter sp. Cpo114]|uniref:hypothetical protein n=1 Tax=Citrobacter sp. Cpo114 TaxID=2985147 RepID=UPI002581A158|nr:hypothetical protein [Citrobacter sp. Cpo114]